MNEINGYGMMDGSWSMGFGWIIPILIIVVLVYIINPNRNESTTDEASAIEILKKRFANGEIDIKEYKEKKNLLEN